MTPFFFKHFANNNLHCVFLNATLNALQYILAILSYYIMESPDLKRKRLNAALAKSIESFISNVDNLEPDVAVFFECFSDVWSEIRKDCFKLLMDKSKLLSKYVIYALFDSFISYFELTNENRSWQACHGMLLGIGAIANQLNKIETKNTSDSKMLLARDICVSCLTSENVSVREASRKSLILLKCNQSSAHMANMLYILSNGLSESETPLTAAYIDGLLCCLEDCFDFINMLEEYVDINLDRLDMLMTIENYLTHPTSTVRQVACRVYVAAVRYVLYPTDHVLRSRGSSDFGFADNESSPVTLGEAQNNGGIIIEVQHPDDFQVLVFNHISKWLCANLAPTATGWYGLESTLMLLETFLHEVVFGFLDLRKQTSQLKALQDLMIDVSSCMRCNYYTYVFSPTFEIRRMSLQLLPMLVRFCCVVGCDAPMARSDKCDRAPATLGLEEVKMEDCIHFMQLIQAKDEACTAKTGSINSTTWVSSPESLCYYLVACRWITEKVKFLQMITETMATSNTAVPGPDGSDAILLCPFNWTTGMQGKLQEEDLSIRLKGSVTKLAAGDFKQCSKLVNLWKSQISLLCGELHFFLSSLMPHFVSLQIQSVDVIESAFLSKMLLENLFSNRALSEFTGALCDNNSNKDAVGDCYWSSLYSKSNFAMDSAIDMLFLFQTQDIEGSPAQEEGVTVNMLLSSIQDVTDVWGGERDESRGGKSTYAVVMSNQVIHQRTSSLFDVAHRQLCAAVATILPGYVVSSRAALDRSSCNSHESVDTGCFVVLHKMLQIMATWIRSATINPLWLDRRMTAKKCLYEGFALCCDLLEEESGKVMSSFYHLEEHKLRGVSWRRSKLTIDVLMVTTIEIICECTASALTFKSKSQAVGFGKKQGNDFTSILLYCLMQILNIHCNNDVSNEFSRSKTGALCLASSLTGLKPVLVTTEKLLEASPALDGGGSDPNCEEENDWDTELEEFDATPPDRSSQEVEVFTSPLASVTSPENAESSDAFSDWDEESEDGDENNNSLMSTASSCAGVNGSGGFVVGASVEPNIYQLLISKIDGMLMNMKAI